MFRGLLLSMLVVSAWAAPASARLVMNAGAGVFDPWYGAVGYEVDVAALATLGKLERWRLGGEFSFRSADTGVADVDSVDFESYRLSFVVHCRFLMGQVIEPYVGARLTTAITRIDNGKVNDERPSRDVQQSGYGLGASAIVGVDVPLGDRLALYGEASVGADIVWIDDGTDSLYGGGITSDGIGGVSGIAGLRVRF